MPLAQLDHVPGAAYLVDAMTGLDYVVILIVGFGAIRGFMRGFVHEVILLGTWLGVLVAIRLLHEPLTAALAPLLPGETGAGVLAYALLTIVPYALARLVAARAGAMSKASFLGPADRLLGLGFGALKGFVILVVAFSLIVFASDLVWGAKGRPKWISHAAIYPVLDAASDELVTLLSDDLPLVGHARSRSCGSTIDLGLALDAGGTIARVGLRARACAVGQAAASRFLAGAAGQDRAGIAAARDDLARWIAGEGPQPDWPGIELVAPAIAYPARHGAILLAWDAALDALARSGGKSG